MTTTPCASSYPSATAEEPSSSQGLQVANVRLRISRDVLLEVDRAVQRRRSGISRHAWIMEAVLEKLAREAHHEVTS